MANPPAEGTETASATAHDNGPTDGLSLYLVHLASLGLEPEATNIGTLRRLQAADRFGVHRLVEDPDQADVIIFSQQHLSADWRQHEIRHHPLVKRYPERSYCFDQRSIPWAALPGVFTSPPASTIDRRYQVPWTYPGRSDVRDRLVASPPRQPDLLFSFVGSGGHVVRDRIFELSHPRAVIESVRNFTFYDPNSRDFDNRRDHFIEIMLRSRFILCPRGLATSSFRCYEAMAAGRVPVIFSDDWLEPAGPDWRACAVRLPEADVASVGAHLEALEADWSAMGAAARQAYDQYFADDVLFHHTVEALRPLVDRGAAATFPRSGIRNRQWVRAGRYGEYVRWRRRALALRQRWRRLSGRVPAGGR